MRGGRHAKGYALAHFVSRQLLFREASQHRDLFGIQASKSRLNSVLGKLLANIDSDWLRLITRASKNALKRTTALNEVVTIRRMQIHSDIPHADVSAREVILTGNSKQFQVVLRPRIVPVFRRTFPHKRRPGFTFLRGKIV